MALCLIVFRSPVAIKAVISQTADWCPVTQKYMIDWVISIAGEIVKSTYAFRPPFPNFTIFDYSRL